jgi:hypothetical protein
MNWKQFLNPDSKKFLIFFLIVFITNTLAQILFMESSYLNSVYIVIINFFLVPGTTARALAGLNVIDMNNLLVTCLISSAAYIIDLFWSYLISCFIIWVHNKLGKKNPITLKS